MEANERKRMLLSFKKYARLGLASERLDPIDAYERIKGCCRCRREARELLAVYDTVRFLRISKNTESLKALYAVYCSLSGKSVRKSEISARVLRFAYEHNCDERTVYRRLAHAASVYSMLLGK